MRYATVHHALLAAFPELRRPYDRLIDDWDCFEDEPPGQYIVFSDTYGTMIEVTLSLEPETRGRDELLQRVCSFGEEMFSCEDSAVRDLAIDSLAETLNNHPVGASAAFRFGGTSLLAWFEEFGSDRAPSGDSETVDLWGVRDELRACFPDTQFNEIPGISHPNEYSALDSLRAAAERSDGAVLLSTFGTTRLLVVIRANQVAVDEASLVKLADAAARRLQIDDYESRPGAHFVRIPIGERVWNMDTAGEKHTRMFDQPWVIDELEPVAQQMVNFVKGSADSYEL